ncbi:MAG TPA: hypothetical protein VI566_15335 [Xanthomonadales bacterium]|nr:hypothetical protein [Xanthomonadales bacterium]
MTPMPNPHGAPAGPRFSWRGKFTARASRAGRSLALLALCGLAGCPMSPVEKNRTEAFKQYETIIRWSQWDAAVSFLAPEYMQEHPVSQLQMDRLRLFRVTQYTVRVSNVLEDGMSALQVVEIRMFNTNQAVERVILDEQDWRYDPPSKRWLLHSGLPDPTRHR